MSPPPQIGWYGDDLTGATDTLSALAAAGRKAVLFLDPPSAEETAPLGALDAIGIAGATRSMTRAAIADALAPVGPFFAGIGVGVLHYKCCSTFDSAPETGNLATAVAALGPSFPNPLRPIVGGQPNLGRYCLFGNLFARAGAGGEVLRLDRHPMSRHPVTPMTEADLRRHLAAQGFGAIAALAYPAYGEAPAALAARLAALLAEKPDAVLLDVSRPSDLDAIGTLLWAAAAEGPLLALGATSVMQALCRAWPQTSPAGTGAAMPTRCAAAGGPVFAVIGSLSPVSRDQMARAVSYDTTTVEAARLAGDDAYRAAVAEDSLRRLAEGRHVVVATGEARTGGPAPAAIAGATATLIADVASRARLARLAVFGGDTASLSSRALGIRHLTCLGTIGDGVVRCRAHAPDPRIDGLETIFKGGQMGPPDLLEQIVHGSPSG